MKHITSFEIRKTKTYKTTFSVILYERSIERQI